MDFCEIDDAAQEIVGLIYAMASTADLEDIVLEIQELGKALVNCLTPEREIQRWERISYEQKETCECCGSVRTATMDEDVPIYDSTPVEEMIAQQCKNAIAMYRAGQAAANADTGTDFAALRAQVAGARDLMAPMVKAEQEYQNHLADMADAASW